MTISAILEDPCTSYWLKDAIISALNRDPCDALNDAETLAAVLRARLSNVKDMDVASR